MPSSEKGRALETILAESFYELNINLEKIV
jgi:hypothetical protein